MSKIVLALDVDGCVAQFFAYLVRIMRRTFANNPEIQSINDITTFKLEDAFTPVQFEAAKSILKRCDFWINIPVIRESIPKVNEYKTTFDLIWLTSPWPEMCEDWERARRLWLKNNFGVHHNDIIFASKERKCQVQADIFIDDYDENILSYQKHNPKALTCLMKAKYNEHITSLKRYTWSELDATSLMRMFTEKQLSNGENNGQ